ncbi:MAG: DNA methyltransferase [bacterium]|nr:DNA methyltransferase [bacterium]
MTVAPPAASGGLRVLELFCGIGGCAAALGPGPHATVAAALDINRTALEVYAHNFSHPSFPLTLESVPASRLTRWGADLWWMSPPCQPFTRRGLGKDIEDPRARALVAVIRRLGELRPRYVALENVPGFLGSRVDELLRETLERSGYTAVRERLLCPSELGIPNRRRRFYLVASSDRLLPVPVGSRRGSRLRDYLDPCDRPELRVDPDLLERYRGALDVVEAEDPEAMTACFTSAYGRSPVRSGSYLATPSGIRRFSPSEILRLLGFPESFELPPELELRNAWRLVGNSLSLAPVRSMLATIPELAELALGRR